MTDKSSEEKDDKLASALKNENEDAEVAKELGVSPSKASYLRKLKQGAKHGKSRSLISFEHGSPKDGNENSREDLEEDQHIRTFLD